MSDERTCEPGHAGSGDCRTCIADNATFHADHRAAKLTKAFEAMAGLDVEERKIVGRCLVRVRKGLPRVTQPICNSRADHRSALYESMLASLRKREAKAKA